MRLRTSSQTPAPGTRRTSTDNAAGTHSGFPVSVQLQRLTRRVRSPAPSGFRPRQGPLRALRAAHRCTWVAVLSWPRESAALLATALVSVEDPRPGSYLTHFKEFGSTGRKQSWPTRRTSTPCLSRVGGLTAVRGSAGVEHARLQGGGAGRGAGSSEEGRCRALDSQEGRHDRRAQLLRQRPVPARGLTMTTGPGLAGRHCRAGSGGCAAP